MVQGLLEDGVGAVVEQLEGRDVAVPSDKHTNGARARAHPLLGPLEGVGPENLEAISRPKKVSIFRAHPFQWPSKWICPPQNYYVLRHINNRGAAT